MESTLLGDDESGAHAGWRVSLCRFLSAFNVPSRESHERQRAYQRAGAALLIAVLVLCDFAQSATSALTREAVVAACLAYAGISLIHAWNLGRSEQASRFLQYLFFVLDLPVAVLALGTAPEDLAFLHPLLLLLVLGAGMRYGRQIMLVSWYLAIACVAVMICLSNYWQANLNLSIATTLMLVIIPRYFGSLISRLETITTELHQLAMYDSLTGLANRRLLMQQLSAYRSRSQRSRRTMAVLLFDLDNFKKVNDELGHAVGDELLVAIATKLKAGVRTEDFLARIGGDEFVMLAEMMSPPDAEAARLVAEKVISAVHQVAGDVCPSIRVSASVGITLFPGQSPAADCDRLLSLADAAMYEAKRAGKSRVAFSKGEAGRQ